ncbi:MAG: hypothetical protein IH842_00510, partial [Thaumarchaeota archaeon]|nr:hypothetical protein [Nitrososphaerota archaeon]
GLYDAEYTTSVEGTYLIDINAQTQGINTNFSTTFDVRSFFEFDIIRTAQSKIDPISNPNSFDVRIDIESFVNENAVTIQETVPSVFEVVTDANVKTVGDRKVLTWNKVLNDDKTFVEYSYSVPNDFPQLYALGPLEINYDEGVFTEARPWFVANDPAAEPPFLSGSRIADTNRNPLGNVDANATVNKNNDIVYAIEVTTGGDKNSKIESGDVTEWFFREDSDGEWKSLSTTSSPVKLVDAGDAGMVDGDVVPSGDRLVGTSCTFIASLEEVESTNPGVVGVKVDKNQCSETQASVDLSAANEGDRFEFKIDQEYKDGTEPITGIAVVIILYTRTNSETLTFTDALHFRVSRTNSETVTITDAVTGVFVSLRTNSETVTITDAVTGVLFAGRTNSETLTITDAVTGVLFAGKTNSETVTITDAVTGVLSTGRTNSEAMTFTDSVTGVLFAGKTNSETLTFTDAVAVILIAGRTNSETMTFTDTVTGVLTAVRSNSETVSLGEDLIGIHDKASDNITHIHPSDETISLTIDQDNSQIVIGSQNAALDTITINLNIENATMDYSDILSGTEVTITNGWTASIDLDNSISGFDVIVDTNDTTTFTGPSGWDGVIDLPTFEQVTLNDTATETFSQVTAFRIGLLNETITLDPSTPAKFTFRGDGGNQGFVAFFENSTDNSIIFINTPCIDANNISLVAAQLGGTGECSIDDGQDLVVWTTHWTKFGSARSPGTGGGGSTGSGDLATASIFEAIILSSLRIIEISYDVCDENIARILVSSDDISLPTVTIQTKSGSVIVKLADEQPFKELNIFTTIDKLLFETALEPDVEFFTVHVDYPVGGKTNSVSSTIHITDCENIITFEELPAEYEVLEYMAPRIYDVKFQIENGTKQSAEIASETAYLDEQELTVSAIIHSQVPLKQVELRYTLTGQSADEFNSKVMTATQLGSQETTLLVSGSISPDDMFRPAITYWIYAIDENLVEHESKHYSIGVKPTFDVSAAIELDITTSKPEGSIIRPTAYVTNSAPESTFGTVSLIVNGNTVSTVAVLLEPGQTPVELEWKIPKVGKQMTYDVQAKVVLYNTSISTETAQLNSFMKTQVIPLSQTIILEPITDKAGKIIAEPSLVYASDYYHENLRFRVLDQDDHCIIGGSEDCAVQGSTLDVYRGKASVEHHGIILNVKSSSPDSSIERFSIDSVDPLPSKLKITLESMDEFVPEASALEDIDLKVKYRTISEIVTVKST